MPKATVATLSLLFALSSTPLFAEHTVVRVWPGDAPGEPQVDGKTKAYGPERVLPDRPGVRKVQRITDVTVPILQLHPAPKDKANGCGVVIFPGGGYNILAWDLEGTEIAQWFNSIGVSAAILKYRVPRRDPKKPHVVPLKDAQRAIRVIKSRAKELGIEDGRLGILGFSAGGHLSVMAGTHWDKPSYERIDRVDDLSCRPDFMAPIYPAYLFDKKDRSKLSPDIRITEKTPPTFLAVTSDDSDRDIQAARLYIALQSKKVPSELHVYTRGGHGYGLRKSKNPVHTWPDRLEAWLRSMGFLAKK
ncbi:MAG: alpha/beta hydrolase, partial [Planctomycetota bacterium]